MIILITSTILYLQLYHKLKDDLNDLNSKVNEILIYMKKKILRN
jgi:hypothetical protein